MPTTFTPNPAGIAAMSRSEWMQERMRRRAEVGRRYAIAIAPRRTGNYAASFKVDSGVRNGRAYGLLYNDVRNWQTGYPYSLALEFGTRYMRAQRILGRTLDVMARGDS